MKIWLLRHGGEGMSERFALFKVDCPPSRERIFSFFREEYPENYGDSDNRINEIVDSIIQNNVWGSKCGYEGASITLENVE